MSSCAGEGQDEYIFVFLVYQQPVGGDVALSVSEPLSFKIVIAVARGQSDTLRQQLHRMDHGGDIAPASGDRPQIFLEARCRLNFVHHLKLIPSFRRRR